MKLKLYLLALPLIVAGCAVTPEPISLAEHMSIAKEDNNRLFAEQEPVDGALTLEEAVARAVRYNFDHRLAMSEMLLQERQLEMTVSNMLPRLAASAGYSVRDNDSASSSFSVRTGRQSLEPSISSERQRETADLTFTWNLLDFGVSYYQAKQQADRALIAVERRRKIINKLIKEVRIAYGQATLSQKLLPKIEPLLKDAQRALAGTQKIEGESLDAVLPNLEYRKNLLRVISQLEQVRADLSVANAQLASLINVPQQTRLRVAPKPVNLAVMRGKKLDMAEMEKVSLVMHPQLREERLQERVDQNSVHKEWVRLLPGVSLTGSLNFDNNQYLLNEVWAEAGVRVTYNLLNLLVGRDALRAAEAQVELGKTRRLAVSVAVLTQINVARHQLENAVNAFKRSDQIAAVDSRISKLVTQGGVAQAEPEFETIRRRLEAIAGEMDRERARGQIVESMMNLYVAMGIDLMPAGIDEKTSISEMVPIVAEALSRIDAAEFPTLPPDTLPPSDTTKSAERIPEAAIGPVESAGVVFESVNKGTQGL